MATGIVSVGLQFAGHEVVSRVALVLTCVGGAGFAADFGALLWGDWESGWAKARELVSLAAGAATAVLGTRFSILGWQSLAEALLALAALLWPVLLVDVVRHWRRRMPGAVFLGCVATQGLAVLGVVLAAAHSVAWLAHAALVLFWLGLVLYCLALTRFDPRQVVEGRGDQWVAGGALAISAMAGAKLVAADGARLPLWSGDDRGVLRAVTLALVVLDAACYLVLLVAEAARPRLGYDVRRWATVFPMGMTATAVLSVAAALDVPWLRSPGQVLLWVAVAVWLAVAGQALAAARAGLRSTAPR